VGRDDYFSGRWRRCLDSRDEKAWITVVDGRRPGSATDVVARRRLESLTIEMMRVVKGL